MPGELLGDRKCSSTFLRVVSWCVPWYQSVCSGNFQATARLLGLDVTPGKTEILTSHFCTCTVTMIVMRSSSPLGGTSSGNTVNTTQRKKWLTKIRDKRGVGRRENLRFVRFSHLLRITEPLSPLFHSAVCLRCASTNWKPLTGSLGGRMRDERKDCLRASPSSLFSVFSPSHNRHKRNMPQNFPVSLLFRFWTMNLILRRIVWIWHTPWCKLFDNVRF